MKAGEITQEGFYWTYWRGQWSICHVDFDSAGNKEFWLMSYDWGQIEDDLDEDRIFVGPITPPEVPK